jgi:hypothetical protein
VECLVFVPFLSAPQLSIELFLQLVIELNAEYLATLVFDLVSHLVVQAIKIGIVARFLRLHRSRVNGLVFRYETLSPNQAFPLLGEGENLPGFLLQNARFPSFDHLLVEEAAKIVLHPRAVAGVSQFGEILDSNHSELGNFGEGMNFRLAERIASVTFSIIRAVTLGEEGSLLGFPG